MVFSLIDVYRDTPQKIYVFKDTNGKEYRMLSSQIKKIWKGNIFQGVKLDSLGRLREMSESHKILENTSGVVHRIVSQRNSNVYDVFTGQELKEFVSGLSEGKNERYVVKEAVQALKKFQHKGKICILKGLRRTGKTTAIVQIINRLIKDENVSPDDILFIPISTLLGEVNKLEESVTDEIVDILKHTKCSYVFVDEVTYLVNIMGRLKFLSDYVSVMKRLVLSGTDSYVWPIASLDFLHGRMLQFDLTYMSFKEYCEVFNSRVDGLGNNEAVDRFMNYGGVVDEDEYSNIPNAFESLQTSVVENIVNTMYRNSNYSKIREKVGILYSEDKQFLTEAVICAVVQACNTQNQEFFRIEGVKIPEVVAELLQVKKGKMAAVKKEVIQVLMGALVELRVFDKVSNRVIETEGITKETVFELVCNVSSLYSTVVGGIDSLSFSTGSVFENLMLSQCIQWVGLHNKQDIRNDTKIRYCRYKTSEKYRNENNKTPEVDIVIIYRKDSETYGCSLVEVKHDDKPQPKHIGNMFLPSMKKAIGNNIERRLVVYRGETQEGKTRDGKKVYFINVYDFLMDIEKYVIVK